MIKWGISALITIRMKCGIFCRIFSMEEMERKWGDTVTKYWSHLTVDFHAVWYPWWTVLGWVWKNCSLRYLSEEGRVRHFVRYLDQCFTDIQYPNLWKSILAKTNSEWWLDVMSTHELTTWHSNLHTYVHWTFRPLWQFTTVTCWPCDILRLWHFTPYLIYQGS
jgi:hypothetical protein